MARGPDELWTAPPRRRGGRFLAIAVVVVVLGIAGVAIWLVERSGAPAAHRAAAATGSATPTTTFPNRSAVPTAPPVAPFTARDATRIASALSSSDRSATAAVLVPEVRAEFVRSGVRAVPPGSTVSVLADRFVAVRPDYASVPMVVTGPRSGNFVAVLLYEQGAWLVVSTQEVQ